MPIRWFCYNVAQINAILMAELFLEMMQWKNFVSAWVQVLDFTKSLVCRQKMFFFFFFLFMCHVCVLSLICLFNILGEFDALHQLSVKKDPWKYKIQSLKTADAVLLSLSMRDNGSMF